MIPIIERQKFENFVFGQAQKFNLTPEEYLRKVWYHEEAAKFGEFMAMTLLEQLLSFLPENSTEIAEPISST